MKHSRRPPPIKRENIVGIVKGLFPTVPETNWDNNPLRPELATFLSLDAEDSLPLFSEPELARVIKRLPSGKAPGPDNIPNELIKIVAKRCPNLFLGTYNACLEYGFFPSVWKKARLVLLPKGPDRPPDLPSSYRPISLLDGTGKVLEGLLLNRLLKHIDGVGALSENQFIMYIIKLKKLIKKLNILIVIIK